MCSLKPFDRVAEVYDATRSVPAEAMAAIVDGIRRSLGDRRAPLVLDLGVGTGRIAGPLAAAQVRVVGVDLSAGMLARLRARCPEVPAARAESTRLPFRSAAFDGVLFVHLLHLVPDATATLRAAVAVLRPGGVLIFGRTDYPESPWRPVNRLVRTTAAEISGSPAETGSPHARAAAAFDEVARALGAERVETLIARWPERLTGRRFLQALERRIYSSSWEIPEAAMPELLRRLAPRLEALLGGLDREVVNRATFSLVAARLAG